MLELWKCHLITAGYRGSADLGLASLGLIYFWKVKRSDSFNIKNVENTEHYKVGKIMVPGVYSPMVLAPSVMAIKISASAFIFKWDTECMDFFPTHWCYLSKSYMGPRPPWVYSRHKAFLQKDSWFLCFSWVFIPQRPFTAPSCPVPTLPRKDPWGLFSLTVLINV